MRTGEATATMTREDLEEAIKAIPQKEEALRNAFHRLLSYSASSSFALPFRLDVLDAHISSLHASISHRFHLLHAAQPASATATSPKAHTTKQDDANANKAEEEEDETNANKAEEEEDETNANKAEEEAGDERNASKAEEEEDDETNANKAEEEELEAEPIPRPELVAACAGMDAEGLVEIITKIRRSRRGAIRREFLPALRHAPDGPKLVLHAVKDILSRTFNKDRDLNTVAALLDSLPAAPSPHVAGEAKNFAAAFEGMPASILLKLLVSYGITSMFSVDEIIRLFGAVPRRLKSIDLCTRLGLADRITDLVDHLIREGKQIDAVKFVHDFNMVEKYPLVSLLKAYAKTAKEAAQEILKEGMKSRQSWNVAIGKEVAALKTIKKTVEEYNLNSEYPIHTIEEQIAKLIQQGNKKRDFADADTASTLESQQNQKKLQQQQNQEQNKQQTTNGKKKQKQEPTQNQSSQRPRSSATATPVRSVPVVPPPTVQIQPQIRLPSHAPYGVMPGVHVAGASAYPHSHTIQALSGIQSRLGAPPVMPHQYLSQPSVATNGLVYDGLAPYDPFSPFSSCWPSVYPR